MNRVSRAAMVMITFAASGLPHLGAAFIVNPTDNPSTLASAILGPGVTIVGTPTLSSQTGQSGVFADFNSGPYTQTGGGAGQFSVSLGVILTTGIATASTGTFIGGPSADLSGSGNALLSALAGTGTFDADVLTIRFTSTASVLPLRFLFASSEYPSFVGSAFVDPFAIFVNGVNVALVPGTGTRVSINSVNPGMNSSFYTQNSTPATPFNYGGVTTLLTANANVSTSSVNTIQFAIADAGDGSLDSALLIQGSGAAAVPEPASILAIPIGGGLLYALRALRGKRQSKFLILTNRETKEIRGEI